MSSIKGSDPIKGSESLIPFEDKDCDPMHRPDLAPTPMHARVDVNIETYGKSYI